MCACVLVLEDYWFLCTVPGKRSQHVWCVNGDCVLYSRVCRATQAPIYPQKLTVLPLIQSCKVPTPLTDKTRDKIVMVAVTSTSLWFIYFGWVYSLTNWYTNVFKVICWTTVSGDNKRTFSYFKHLKPDYAIRLHCSLTDDYLKSCN